MYRKERYKKYERGHYTCREIPESDLILVGHDVHLDKSEILYECKEFTDEILKRDFDVKSGEWYVEDGWVVGKQPKVDSGILLSKADYFGDVMLELTCKLVDPSTHDINVMISGSWNDEKNTRDLSYIAGLEAFWHGNIGFEKSPEYRLVVSNDLLDFDPTAEYHLQFGNLNGFLFVRVNGRVALEVRDPDRIDTTKCGKIGFEAYSSWWKFKDVKVLRPNYDRVTESYAREF